MDDGRPKDPTAVREHDGLTVCDGHVWLRLTNDELALLVGAMEEADESAYRAATTLSDGHEGADVALWAWREYGATHELFGVVGSAAAEVWRDQ